MIAHVKQLILHLAVIALEKLFNYVIKRVGMDVLELELNESDECYHVCDKEDIIR